MPELSSAPRQPRREQQLAPGVYFTPGPQKPLQTDPSPRPVQELSLDELRGERDALLKSIEMLLASNAEMRDFDPTQKDLDLVQAISENMAIIVKRRARAALLEERISVLSLSQNCDVGTQGQAVDGSQAGLQLPVEYGEVSPVTQRVAESSAAGADSEQAQPQPQRPVPTGTAVVEPSKDEGMYL